MGLPEKRRIKELQEQILPTTRKEIETLCGVDIPWEVDWDSFAPSMAALSCLDSYGFNYVVTAFKNICIDDLGKEAVRESVKKIIYRKAPAVADMKLSFSGGVLEIVALQEGSGWDGYYSSDQIQTLLEKNL